MITTHRRHHRAAARAGRHDGAAHGVPDVHEGQGPRGIRAHAVNGSATRADGRKIIADPAALLHGQRGLFQPVENAAHIVGDRAHDETVEEGHRPRRASARGDPACGEVFEILKSSIEPILPKRGIFLDDRKRTGDAAPAVFHRAIHRRAIGLFEPILHVPDLFSDGRGETGHRVAPVEILGGGGTTTIGHHGPVAIAEGALAESSLKAYPTTSGRQP